ncbi:trypsin inhibitor [Musca vetustissima]|uniref:trypsin inhibitor n=1 Tax=Musca vetustissima TaxID=27455 RepID=UPI002AB62B1A|nr:trypsin inhibitor [Musca vetustissima]
MSALVLLSFIVDSKKLSCLEPKTPGLCRGKFLRYAYDRKSGKCISFYYSGCGATQNNFLTYEECRRDCMQQLRY